MRSPTAQNHDIDVIAQRLRDEQTTGALSEIKARSLASRLKLFGYRVEQAADGTRTLLPDR